MKDCGTPKVLEIKCPGEVVLLHKVIVTPDMGDETTFPPKIGLYKNVLLQYQSSGNIYLYSSDGIPTKIEDTADIARLEQMIEDETEARILEDADLQDQIDTIKAASDVVDIVGSYAELEAYDTSKLNDNDIIKVLEDETHDDDITYYRWSTTTETFTYIGAQAAYYSKDETDNLLADKQDTLIAGSNIQIAADGKTISATDTTYTHFTGATASTDGVQGLVPGPLAGDEDKVLKGDGTWGTIQSASNTIFYMNASETGATRHLYKNSDMTGLATMQDIIDANEEGQVIVRISTSVTPSMYSDMYLQNAYVATGDYQMIFLDNQYYYSFDTTQTSDNTFEFAKSEVQRKLTAGANIQINGNTISATDTTYSNFVGTDGQTAGSAGLVPAPATTDDGKYLKADGTWATLVIPPSVNVINTIATDYASASTTDAMGQQGVYLQVHNSNNGIQIGGNGAAATAGYSSSVAIGGNSIASNVYAVALGTSARTNSSYTTALGSSTYAYRQYGTAVGYNSLAYGLYSVALGASSGTGTSSSSSYGQYTVAIGYSTSIMGSECVAVGAGALAGSSNTCSYNTAVGRSASAGVYSNNNTAIGYKATTRGQSGGSTAIGANANNNTTNYGTTLGASAQIVTGNYNVVLGYMSKADTDNSSDPHYNMKVVSFGDGSNSANYGKRMLINVADGTEASDAATVGQLTTGLASKQNTLTAGTGISIVGDTISATGSSGAVLTMADWNDVFNNA